MPLYRHECTRCRVERLDLLRIDDPNPDHCGATMRRIMPRRVVGRVVPDSNGAHVGSGFAQAGHVDAGPDTETEQVVASASCMPSSLPAKRIDPDDKLSIPWNTKPLAKDYADCDAAERDGRWHDTCQRMTEWQASCLEQDGIGRGEALRRASQLQQTVTEQARAENTRDDGLT